MEVVRVLETPVYFNETTRRYIPEGCHSHTRNLENLNSKLTLVLFVVYLTVLFVAHTVQRRIKGRSVNDELQRCGWMLSRPNLKEPIIPEFA
jgi:hypothetical protein